jgi:hypothetical protein
LHEGAIDEGTRWRCLCTADAQEGGVMVHASRVTWAATAACFVYSMIAAPDLGAQTRFDLLSADAVPAVQGLNVYTIRDNQLAVCYSVFIADSADATASNLPVPEPPPPTPAQLEQARVAQALKDAVATYGRQLADLQKQNFLMWSVEYVTAQERIRDEYEQSVRRVLPTVYPSAQVAPGYPTSTWDEMNAAVRRAIAEGEAPNVAADRAGIDERIEYLLRRATASARLAVTGPTACPTPARPPVR